MSLQIICPFTMKMKALRCFDFLRNPWSHDVGSCLFFKRKSVIVYFGTIEDLLTYTIDNIQCSYILPLGRDGRYHQVMEIKPLVLFVNTTLQCDNNKIDYSMRGMFEQNENEKRLKHDIFSMQ